MSLYNAYMDSDPDHSPNLTSIRPRQSQQHPSPSRAPSYTAEPLENEQRIALSNHHTRPRPSGSFIKQSKDGHVRLRLIAQENGLVLPVYGVSGVVEGFVELDEEKVEGVDSVEIKIEGRLKLNEVAEGGTTSAKLVLETTVLWEKKPDGRSCPTRLKFGFKLPTTFVYEGIAYPLPPTYGVKLAGLPGFTASVDYSVGTYINRPNAVSSMVPGPLVTKSKTLGFHFGNIIVSTPFIYYPRTRPSQPLPNPLRLIPRQHFQSPPDWRIYETISKAKSSKLHDIHVKFYIPYSRSFCLKQKIPFHLSLHFYDDVSLATFLPFGPIVGRKPQWSSQTVNKAVMKVEVHRQATVDIQNEIVTDAKQDIWRVDAIGEGIFNLYGNESLMNAYFGEIEIFDTVRIGGFKAAGLTVKDCIVLSMSPTPDPRKCPFTDFRLVVPIRLATDPWTPDGTGIGLGSVRN